MTPISSGPASFGCRPARTAAWPRPGCSPADCGALLQAALTPLAAPRPAADGTLDPRTGGQRRHDALHELAGYRLGERQLADSGAATTVIITLTAEQAATGIGLAETSLGQLLPVPAALKMMDEAVVLGLVRDARGAVLNLYRHRRIASREQTLALIARDKGCSFPGCDQPPELCQRHHVVPCWRHGPTNLDNLTLVVCGYHHREFDRLGWQCVMTDGLPRWIPPPHLDPHRAPRLNHRITLRQ